MANSFVTSNNWEFLKHVKNYWKFGTFLFTYDVINRYYLRFVMEKETKTDKVAFFENETHNISKITGND